MAVESVELTKTDWPIKIRAKKPPIGPGVRTIRIGLLGLGNVGQAVARLSADRGATEHAGVRFKVEQALVRDVTKARLCPNPDRAHVESVGISTRSLRRRDRGARYRRARARRWSPACWDAARPSLPPTRRSWPNTASISNRSPRRAARRFAMKRRRFRRSPFSARSRIDLSSPPSIASSPSSTAHRTSC